MVTFAVPIQVAAPLIEEAVSMTIPGASAVNKPLAGSIEPMAELFKDQEKSGCVSKAVQF